LTQTQWRDVIDVNLTGVWNSIKAVAPHMLERQAGSVVVIASVAGLRPGATYSHYGASKSVFAG
jgi:NADP-dependent 3-hydroxy acid dehydrogenase YdfG